MKLKHQVLIVDDDVDDREIIKDAFVSGNNEMDFIFVENGDTLMPYIHAHIDAVSLILLDLNMPGKDGRELLKEIKTDKRYHHVPIVVFTTSRSQRDRIMAYDLGANCFISKPDTFNKLVEITGCIAKLWL